jgi:hypothetical protein
LLKVPKRSSIKQKTTKFISNAPHLVFSDNFEDAGGVSMTDPLLSDLVSLSAENLFESAVARL